MDRQIESALAGGADCYRLLFDLAQMRLLEVDPQGRILKANSAALRLIGADGDQNICGQSFLGFDDGCDRQLVRELIYGAKAAPAVEIGLRMPSGGEYHRLAETIAPVRNPGDRVTRLIGVDGGMFRLGANSGTHLAPEPLAAPGCKVDIEVERSPRKKLIASVEQQASKRFDLLLLTGKECTLAADLRQQGRTGIPTELARLRAGSPGPEVSALQRKLRFSDSDYFWPATKQRLTEHQRRMGIPADGVYDRPSWTGYLAGAFSSWNRVAELQ